MEFAHGFVHQGLVYLLDVPGSRVNQAGGGHVVDLAGCSPGIVVDEILGLGVEGFTGSPCQRDPVVDIGARLLLRESVEREPHGDPMNQVGVRGALQDVPEGFLAAQDDFKRYFLLDGGYEKPKIGQGLRINQMGLVDDEKHALLVLLDAGEDLKEHPVLAHLGFFPEPRDDKPQEGVGADGGEMKIERLIPVLGKFMDKEPEERRLPHARLAEDEGDGALLLEELETGKGLFDAGIPQKPLNRRFFGEGMGGQGKMTKKHYLSPFKSCLSSRTI